MFLSFSIFSFGRHCWRRWSKLNPKVHKISIGCTRTFKPNFVWYLEKQNRFDIKTWSIYRVLGGVHPLVRAHQLLGRHTHLLLSLHLFVSSNLKDGIKKIPTLIAFFKQLLSDVKMETVNFMAYFSRSPPPTWAAQTPLSFPSQSTLRWYC